MQRIRDELNSPHFFRHAVVGMIGLAFAIGITRFAAGGDAYTVTQQGFKIENTSSTLHAPVKPLPWLAGK